MKENEQRILTTWQHNAVSWTRAVREGAIASRQQVTNQAIIDAIQHYQPTSVIDIGCGEGWLARQLSRKGMEVTGIDATQALIDAAQKSGGGHFITLEYAQLKRLTLGGTPPKYDMAVCNFSLLGESSTEAVLVQLPALINHGGYLLIQTLHPSECNRAHPYQDGWQQSSWDGFDNTFSNPAPWYFRTLSSWLALLRRYNFQIQEVREPLSPTNSRAISVIFIATPS
jgi:2-polyprenyl-3-methyl-5-hydroxy-6-metoxy-1,4-benzoquinol methylase